MGLYLYVVKRLLHYLNYLVIFIVYKVRVTFFTFQKSGPRFFCCKHRYFCKHYFSLSIIKIFFPLFLYHKIRAYLNVIGDSQHNRHPSYASPIITKWLFFGPKSYGVKKFSILRRAIQMSYRDHLFGG